jgi:YD repeat-containing protein
VNLSKFDYTYDAEGKVRTWRQELGANAPVIWEYGYDAADQLVAALKRTNDLQTVLRRHYYAYDAAGNRTAEQIDDNVVKFSYDNLNRLVAQQAGGPIKFVGTTSEPANVTVAGIPAVSSADNVFSASPSLASGANTVSIVATDPNGNATTKQYQLTLSGTPRTFNYDANGNMISDGVRTYEWNARNQLHSMSSSGGQYGFTYDAKGRRQSYTGYSFRVVREDQ